MGLNFFWVSISIGANHCPTWLGTANLRWARGVKFALVHELFTYEWTKQLTKSQTMELVFLGGARAGVGKYGIHICIEIKETKKIKNIYIIYIYIYIYFFFFFGGGGSRGCVRFAKLDFCSRNPFTRMSTHGNPTKYGTWMDEGAQQKGQRPRRDGSQCHI